MRPLKIAVAGIGTIGAVVVERLQRQSARLAQQSGRSLELVAVSARKKRDLGVAFVADPLDLAAREDIAVIVELIGGADGIAHELVLAALGAGKHVVTANKALLAKHGVALAQLAEEKGLALNYEAAVAGSVPIVKTLRESCTGFDIHHIDAILNSTSNYILHRMADDGLGFAEALAQAQNLGYAEADPRFDIDGTDAAHKLNLISSLAFGVVPEAIPTIGIDAIEAQDMKLASDLGYAIRLIAHARKEDHGVDVGVRPMLVGLNSRLAQSYGTGNVIVLTGKSGTLLLEGAGAGAEPTSNGVIADLVDIARNICLPVFGMQAKNLVVQPAIETSEPACFYIRATAADRAGSMAAITNIMARADISLAGVSQPHADLDPAPIALMTHSVLEAQVKKAISDLSQLEAIAAPPLFIQVKSD